MESVFASSPPPKTETKYGSGESVAENRMEALPFPMDSSRKRAESRQNRRMMISLPRCRSCVMYSGPYNSEIRRKKRTSNHKGRSCLRRGCSRCISSHSSHLTEKRYSARRKSSGISALSACPVSPHKERSASMAVLREVSIFPMLLSCLPISFFKASTSDLHNSAVYISRPRSGRLCASSIRKVKFVFSSEK